MLINISGISARTFYRRLEELRNQKLIEEQKKYYMDLDQAKKLATAMGFLPLLEKHIDKSSNKK
jgi:hypothetical protein